MDKDQIMIEFLRTCPVINADPMFFNFGNVQDGAHQILTQSDEIDLHKPYIDGSVEKRFTFYLDNFKSVSYNPIVITSADENLEEYQEIQSIIDWITEQDELGNYPDFGENIIIDRMTSVTENPDMVGVDRVSNTPIAVYRISIRIDFLDITKKLWK